MSEQIPIAEKKTMTFTHELREELRNRYVRADNDGQVSFEFHGVTMLTEYAKYLLEYLDMKLPHVSGVAKQGGEQ